MHFTHDKLCYPIVTGQLIMLFALFTTWDHLKCNNVKVGKISALLICAQIEVNPHLCLENQELFSERIANQIDKRMRMHEFVYKICMTRGKDFLSFVA